MATVKRTDLSSALDIVKPAVAKRTTIPILSHVAITFTNGIGVIRATNQRVSIAVDIDATTGLSEVTAFTVPHEVLSDWVGEQTGETIDIELVGSKISLKCGKARKASINVMLIDEFPDFPELAAGTFTIPAEEFSTMAARTVFCASVDPSRMAYTGILFNLGGGILDLVATDAIRLSIARAKISGERAMALVPATTCNDVAKVAKGPMTVGITQGAVSFDMPQIRTRVTAQTIDANFVRYESFIQSDFTVCVATDTANLLSAMRSAKVFAKDAATAVTFDISKDGLSITSETAQVGDSDTLVEDCECNGDTQLILRSDSVIKVLDVIGSKRVEIQAVDNKHPITILDPDAPESFLHIMAPLGLRKTDR